MFVAGALDLLAPPPAVRGGYELWAGEKELWVAGREAGLSTDYGHSDLIFGRNAPEEIYPRVVTCCGPTASLPFPSRPPLDHGALARAPAAAANRRWRGRPPRVGKGLFGGPSGVSAA